MGWWNIVSHTQTPRFNTYGELRPSLEILGEVLRNLAPKFSLSKEDQLGGNFALKSPEFPLQPVIEPSHILSTASFIWSCPT